MFVGVFLVSGKWIEKLCVSSALPFVECVAVWALKLPVPHTDVLKPTRHKAFLFIYRKLKKYEHLTLTTNQLVESSFLGFQDKSRKKSCIETADPFAQSHSLANSWWAFIRLSVKQKKNFVTRGFECVGMRHWWFQCPYRYALNKRECPRDAKFFFCFTKP